jgi:hypothetical protein
MPADKLPSIPSSVLMLVVIGSNDQFASTRQDKTIWAATKQIPDSRRRYIVVQSDDHGTPPLAADHSSPLAFRSDYGTPPTDAQRRRIQLVERFTGMRENAANALNYWGYWRLFDALTEAAFAGRDIEAALGAARPLGRWSDGTPMKPWTESRTP